MNISGWLVSGWLVCKSFIVESYSRNWRSLAFNPSHSNRQSEDKISLIFLGSAGFLVGYRLASFGRRYRTFVWQMRLDEYWWFTWIHLDKPPDQILIVKEVTLGRNHFVSPWLPKPQSWNVSIKRYAASQETLSRLVVSGWTTCMEHMYYNYKQITGNFLTFIILAILPYSIWPYIYIYMLSIMMHKWHNRIWYILMSQWLEKRLPLATITNYLGLLWPDIYFFAFAIVSMLLVIEFFKNEWLMHDFIYLI